VTASAKEVFIQIMHDTMTIAYGGETDPGACELRLGEQTYRE
jgi:hypothetical protein